MNRKIVKSYNNFVNEGKREQVKLDELLDIMSKRKLTKEEKDLLDKLSKGESLDDDSDKPSALQSHKTGGGYLFDQEGNVLTAGEEEDDKPGQEFYTAKGKQRSAEKLKRGNFIDARIYRNKDSDERMIFANITVQKGDNVENDWLIYRSGSQSGKFPMGQFMDTKSPKYSAYKTKTPEIMWKDLDLDFDYGMVLDQDLYEDFINFVELYKENQVRHKDILTRLRRRFLGLL